MTGPQIKYPCTEWLKSSPSFFSLIYTDKTENQLLLIYKKIQNGAVAMSYMSKCSLSCEEMHKYLTLYEESVNEENLIFFLSVYCRLTWGRLLTWDLFSLPAAPPGSWRRSRRTSRTRTPETCLQTEKTILLQYTHFKCTLEEKSSLATYLTLITLKKGTVYRDILFGASLMIHFSPSPRFS